ncbi:hypothetical protein [Nitrosophilus labii]|uniref:hypothetical protein n=1 Tax=Nitrosophilus labii TaxID=2706014 RepID=UPI0016574C31|nr:hypothetical protein [Nitrosophilus labii]
MRTILNWFAGYIIKVILMYLMLAVFGAIAFVAFIFIDDYKTAVEWITNISTNGLGKVVLSMPIWFPFISSISSINEKSSENEKIARSRMKKESKKIDMSLMTNDSSFM